MEKTYQIPARGSCSPRERQGLWQQIIADQESSGLKMTRFCEEHQLNLSTFKQWKYFLQQDNKKRDDRNHECKIDKEERKEQNGKLTTRFVPLQITANNLLTDEHSEDKNNKVKAEGVIESVTRMEIVFKNGHSIIMPSIVTAEELMVLIEQVAKLAC